jgi:tetratricopeptide (TPR) repeat protein
MPRTKTRRIVRQKAKGPIDPAVGLRVRVLREARGLTQAEIAGTAFTPAFISLVETGRTRMSLRAAELVAAKLGVAVTDLLAPAASPSSAALELSLIQAETDLRSGDAAAALQRTDDLLPVATATFKARVQRLRGRALVALGRPREAVSQLDEALRSYRGAADRELAVRVMYDLAVAHARLDQVNEALYLGLECERALLNREVVDRTLELQVLSFLCAAFVRLGDFGSADLRTERAAAVANDVTDLGAVASLYASLAITRQEQKDHDAALAYARRSLAAYEALGHQQAVATTWNTSGWVLMQKSNFRAAGEALDRADALARAHHHGPLAAVILQTRAELAHAKNDFGAAVTLAEESAAHPDASVRCHAGSLLVRAQALARTRVPLAKVHAAFKEAIAAGESEGRRHLARVYQAYFEALSARKQSADAVKTAAKAFELLQPTIT